MLALCALFLVSFLAAVHASGRLGLIWRIERLLAALVLWHGNMFVVTQVAGFTNTFTRLGTTTLWLLGSLGLFAVGGFRRADVHASWRLLLLELPGAALRCVGELLRRRSFALLSVLMIVGLIGYLGAQMIAAPMLPFWDPLWYHEPQVAFTVQYHGFDAVSLPNEVGANKANGYPRFVEAMAALFVLHGHRTVIELPNLLGCVLLVVASYVLLRRWSQERALPIAVVAYVLVMPATAQHVQTLFNDVPMAAYLVALFAMVCRPTLRMGTLVLASLAAMMALAVKWIAYMVAPLAVAMLLGRWCLQRSRVSRGRFWLGAVIASVLPGAYSLLWPLRNLRAFGNPFWPDLKLDMPRLGIHWPGAYEMGDGSGGTVDGGQVHVDINLPWSDLVADAFRVPWVWTRWHYQEISDYGIAALFVVFPLFPLVATALLLRALRRGRGLPAAQRPAPALIVALLGWLVLTPAAWASRYHVAWVVGAAALLVLAVTAFARTRAAELAGIMVLTSVLSLAWCHRYWIWPSEMKRLFALSPQEREYVHEDFFDRSDVMGVEPQPFGSNVAPAMARRRDRRRPSIGFSGHIGSFWSNLWDHSYSNRVVYVPFHADRYAQDLDAAQVDWVVCARSFPCGKYLAARPEEWSDRGAWFTDSRDVRLFLRTGGR